MYDSQFYVYLKSNRKDLQKEHIVNTPKAIQIFNSKYTFRIPYLFLFKSFRPFKMTYL